MKNGDLPMKNGDLPMKNGDLPVKKSDLPIKHGQLYLVGGIPTPLKNNGVKVSWDFFFHTQLG